MDSFAFICIDLEKKTTLKTAERKDTSITNLLFLEMH